MRITGGEWTGRTIKIPPGEVRPAMDRMRESFFSIMAPWEGIRMADIFSGTGIMALEALSRGAIATRSVEMDRGKRDVLLENLSLGGDAAQLSIMPAERFIMGWREEFSVIFLDPPFPYKFKEELLVKLCSSRIVKEGTKVCIHSPRNDRLADHYGPKQGTKRSQTWNLDLIDHRSYGNSQLRIYLVSV